MELGFLKKLFNFSKKKKHLPLTWAEIEAFHHEILEHNKSFAPLKTNELVIWSKPFRRSKYVYLKKLLNSSDSIDQSNAIASWGLGRKTLELLKIAKENNKPLLLLEDGFIRSLYTWAAKVDPELNAGVSFCIDTKAMYYDGTTSTDLENLLNTEIVSETQCQQARKNIDTIVKNRISKYNNQPLSSEHLTRGGASETNFGRRSKLRRYVFNLRRRYRLCI